MDGDRIGIEFITTLGLPPVAAVGVVAGLGCRFMGVGLAPITAGIHPPWSLRDDRALRHDLRAAMADHGIAPSLGEGFLAWPGQPANALAGDLDIMAEIGAPLANIASLDPDLSRAADVLAAFAELAQERGLGVTVEFLPGLPMRDLPTALGVVRRAGHPNLALLVDAMHLFRSGGTAAEIAALDPALVGYVQLCDCPRDGVAGLTYADEARLERRVPGEGDLPLLDLVRAVPRDRVIGLEVPMRTKADAGVPLHDALAPAVAAARRLVVEAAG